LLIAGDAFVTTQQESALSVMLQTRKIAGPPRYLTSDWEAAGKSVAALAALEPEIVATGHGQPMRGSQMRKMLHKLADNFEEVAVPHHGRYSKQPAVADESGVTFIPTAPDKKLPIAGVVAGIAMVATVAWLLYRKNKKRRESFWMELGKEVERQIEKSAPSLI